MRLVSYGPPAKERCGLQRGDQIIDLNRASLSLFPEPLPWSMIEFLGLDNWHEMARKVSEAANLLEEKAFISLSEVRLGAPVPRPSKIIALGANYREHVEEMRANVELPKRPILFSKASSSAVGPHDDVLYPPETHSLDYEVELAVVIGKRACRVKAEQAYDYIAGYMVLNDVSARDIQLGGEGKLGSQWFHGKSFDTFAPMGPFLTTLDEVGDPHSLRIWLAVNGEIRQDSSTSQLHFKIPEIIAFISHGITLFPGDVISTGTPSGVGIASNPPRLLQVGDVMVAEVEKLGALKNRVTSGMQGVL